MRQDKVLFDGPNPFDSFTRCKELTILLDEERIVLVGTITPINLMVSYKSIIRQTDENDGIRKAYTIPLSLILPLFRLDTQKIGNQLTIETDLDSVSITYNGVELTSDIYSPNGLTIGQVDAISIADSKEYSPLPFIMMNDTFGLSTENFLNVVGNRMYIKDDNKCLIEETEEDYGRNFAMPIAFIRLMKAFECEKMHIGNLLIAEGKQGVLLICNMSKVTGEEILSDYDFARRLKSKDIYTLSLARNLKQIALAVKSADIDVKLDLGLKQLILHSVNKEKVVIPLLASQIEKQGASTDFLTMMMETPKSLILNDARLVRTLASFDWVKIKVCPTFLVANLGKKYKLLFTLRRN